ncbi:(Fe-S)-binding protein [candidate division KSB1 bacterium]|nr:(Fe-S)-binding protein [candidate division KSB1 bacterium]RQW01812.1 MAG: (Fe-S)-binding protein [candidate division KSB1 bacterium]
MKVALFIPCLSEHLYPESALSMVKVLSHIGAEIDYVDGQTCCGQPAFNSGYHKEIFPLAERFIELFHEKEYVVAPSGSCVAMVRKFYYDLDIRRDLHAARDELAGKIFEFTEFLVDVVKVEKLGGVFPHRVTYHDSCHLNRELGVHEQPRQLIRTIKDIDFVEMQQPDLCCGFGGTFSYKFKELSISMVERKCRYIEESGAEYCIGADSSCLMNIEGYLRRHNMRTKTMHIADLIATSLTNE